MYWQHFDNALSFFLLVQLVDTTVELANKVGAAEIISRVVEDLKDDNEQYRKMVMEAIEKVHTHKPLINVHYWLTYSYHSMVWI